MTTLDRVVETAKKWGAANGYKGKRGGWIYDAKGKVVVQSWAAFAFKFRIRIASEMIGQCHDDVQDYLRHWPVRPRITPIWPS